MRTFPMLAVAVVMSSCGSGGAQRTEVPAPASSAAAPTGQADAAVDTRQALAGEATAPGGTQFVPPAGYQKRSHEGKTVYCKSETPVGTRFSRRYCFTQDQLERIEANRRNVQREVDRARRTCVAAGPYCGGD